MIQAFSSAANNSKETEILKTRIEKVDREVKSKILELMKSRPGFELPKENYEEATLAFDLIKVSELSNSILAAVGFGCAAISSDMEYSDFPNSLTTRNILLTSCTVSTIILLLSITWRTHCTLQWERARALFSKYDTVFSSQKLKSLLVEILINLVHPFWPVQGLNFESYNTVHSVNINYAYNDILTIFMILRIYHLVRLYSVFSKYRTERAFRVCRINGRFAGTSWAVKCLMNDNPFSVVFVMMVAGMLVGGFSVRIFERPLEEYSGFDYGYYGNAFWYVMVTMTTVGYGDYYPSSLPGRIIGLMVCVWGVLMISIMVFSVTNLLNLSTFEDVVLSLYKKLEYKDELKVAAGKMLLHAFRFKQCSKDFPDSDDLIAIALGKYQRSVKEFQKCRLKKKILYKLNSAEDNIDRRIDYINTLAHRYNERSTQLAVSLEELFK